MIPMLSIVRVASPCVPVGAALLLAAASARGQCDDVFIQGTPLDSRNLGLRVAISGDTIVSGATVFIRVGGIAGLGNGGGYWTQQAEINDPQGQRVYTSGGVAILGDTFMFSGPGRDMVYVTHRSQGVWSAAQALSRSPVNPFDDFGGNIAMNSLPARTLAVVGAGGTQFSTGAAFVFTTPNPQTGSWTQTGFLQASDPTQNTYFGGSVAASGSTIAIGAAGNPNSGVRGAVYVFTGSLTGTNWTQQAKITAIDGGPDDYFAETLSLSGVTLVVSGSGAGQGAAYVYVRAAGVWSLVAEFFPRHAGLYSGTVAIDGDRIAVLAAFDPPDFSNPGNGRGLVDIYTRPSGSGITGQWTYQRTIVPSDQILGYADLAVSGNVLAMGCPNSSPEGIQSAGELHAITLVNPCPADFDCSGVLEVHDIFAFLDAWFGGNLTADFNASGALEVADIFAFLNTWFAGC